jgi:hypothetical protein
MYSEFIEVQILKQKYNKGKYGNKGNCEINEIRKLGGIREVGLTGKFERRLLKGNIYREE